MAENLEATGGLVYSQAVLLALTEHGPFQGRGVSHRPTECARDLGQGGDRSMERLAADPECDLNDRGAGESCFSNERFFVNTDVVFERLEATTI